MPQGKPHRLPQCCRPWRKLCCTVARERSDTASSTHSAPPCAAAASASPSHRSSLKPSFSCSSTTPMANSPTSSVSIGAHVASGMHPWTEFDSHPRRLGSSNGASARVPNDGSEPDARFRDAARRLARSHHPIAGAWRFTGLPDPYGKHDHAAPISANLITSHTSPTLRDLASYSTRRNEPNLGEHLDGPAEECPSNLGAEGEPRDPEVARTSARMVRNLVCQMPLPLGTPLLLGGDELLRARHGNNDSYLQEK